LVKTRGRAFLAVSPVHYSVFTRKNTSAGPRIQGHRNCGSSEKSVEDAIHTAIARASSTLKHLRWFELVQTRGHIEGGKVQYYQVILKVGFTLEEA
jgi:flavin-binding protein dodecin